MLIFLKTEKLLLKNTILLFLILIFLFLRFYHLSERLNFSMDQGKTLLSVYTMWQQKNFSLIGPETSVQTKTSHHLFHGPWIYYLILPFMLISKWNPLAGSYFFIILNLYGLILLYLAVANYFNLKVGFLTALLFAITPFMVDYSLFIWNPNLLPFISILTLVFCLKIIKNPQNKNFLSLGMILGFGLANHYQFLMIVILTFIWMLIRKFKLASFAFVFTGILIPLLPLIVFELKHQFYNLKTAWEVIFFGSAEPLKLHLFYFLSLTPFIFLVVGLLLNKVVQKNKLWGKIFLAVTILILSFQSLRPKDSGFTMPLGWNYLGIQKAKQIILSENVQNYNIANLLSGDTRDYPLRCLLTIAQKPALSVNQYPQAQYLFVISQHDTNLTLNNPVWEISSFCPCKLIKNWPIQNNIKLYLLDKQ